MQGKITKPNSTRLNSHSATRDMQLIKYKYHLVILAFSTVVIGLSQCATEPEEKSTILLATNARPLTNVKFEASEKRIKRGEYLANGILMCMTCHSPRDTTEPGFPPIHQKKEAGQFYMIQKKHALWYPI